MNDILVSPDREIKSLGNGRYGGFLVIFSDEQTPDLVGDFFSKNTEFFIEDNASLPILYDHGFDESVKREKVGTGKVSFKDEGLWLEFQLNRRAKYITAIERLCTEGKAGLSSGAASHLVSRQEMKAASWVAEWGIAEASITPVPAEPRTSIISLKSYADSRRTPLTVDDEPKENQPIPTSLAVKLNQVIDDLVDEGRSRDSIIKSLAREAVMDSADVEKVLDGEIARPSNARLKAFARVLELNFDALKSVADKFGPQNIKGAFADALADRTPSIWELHSTFCDIMRKFATIAKSAATTGVSFNLASNVKEAVQEYSSQLNALVLKQINTHVEGSEEEFYLRALVDPSQEDFVSAKNVDIDDHCSLAVSAFKSVIARLRANHEARVKAGRVLSEKNRQRLAKWIDQIQALVTDAKNLLDETQPMASDTEKRAALTAFLRNQQRSKELGAHNGRQT